MSARSKGYLHSTVFFRSSRRPLVNRRIDKMAAVMVGAAGMAYRKASADTRDKTIMHQDTPPWLRHIGMSLKEDDSRAAPPDVLHESTFHRKQRLFKDSKDQFERCAWKIYYHVTSRFWFEVFIMVNILAVGVTTGLDLENHGRDNWTIEFSSYVTVITLTVFTLEVALKVASEGYQPWYYFTDQELGSYNTFDFFIVLLSFVFISGSGAISSAVRMLRLIRLLTFIKYVPQLRVLISGLFNGVKSVIYIVLLLFMVIYIFAILGCIMFGENDPAHFGDVFISMVSLFQVSTLASWTSIAYVSWFGCKGFADGAYENADQPASRIHTLVGNFEGFKCDVDEASPLVTGFYFFLYILMTSWVIMSLFIGVISMGMFSTYIKLKNESHLARYIRNIANNTMFEEQAKARLPKTRETYTLKQKIDMILNDNSFGKIQSCYDSFVEKSIEIRDHSYFMLLVTFTILVIGGSICPETNKSLKCARLKDRLNENDALDDDEIELQVKECLKSSLFVIILGVASQAVFTFEAFIKIAAEGLKPWRYFTSPDQGAWNCIDFFIVVVGFLELTPASFVFKNFPVVILRLLRLLRVFRLAKAFPRLRSIVEALVSGFSSVGWICILFTVFNYIVACMCMIIFRENDPFHFGSISRAMFTIFRIETLDTWDQILYIAMYGCEKYPYGYQFLDHVDHARCNKEENTSTSFGWIGVIILFSITIVGAYILPVVLIGVVSIKFDNATKLARICEHERTRYLRQLEKSKEAFPDFFNAKRLEMIEDVFLNLDSSGEHTLDMNEIAPFIYYAIAKVFEVEITHEQFETLFCLLDTNLSSEIGHDEFLAFITILKDIQQKTKLELSFAKSMFGSSKRIFDEGASNLMNDRSRGRKLIVRSGSTRDCKQQKTTKWDRSMENVDRQTLDSAWESILHSVNGIEGNNTGDKVKTLFKDFDSDGTGELDVAELGEGLKACGIQLNERQVHVLAKSIDIDGDGTINAEEFAVTIQGKIHEIAEKKDNDDFLKVQQALNKSNKSSSMFDARRKLSSAKKNSTGELQSLIYHKGELTRQIDKLRKEIVEETSDQSSSNIPQLFNEEVKYDEDLRSMNNSGSFDFQFADAMDIVFQNKRTIPKKKPGIELRTRINSEPRKNSKPRSRNIHDNRKKTKSTDSVVPPLGSAV